MPDIIEAHNHLLHLFTLNTLSLPLNLSHAAPEGAPRELTANSTGPTTVALSWQAPHTDEHNGRLLSYTLEYSISESPDTAQEISVPVDSSEGGDQQRVVEGLQPHTTYQFRVRAVNEVGAGPFSNPVVIITQEDGKYNLSNCRKCSLASLICLDKICKGLVHVPHFLS